MKRKILGMMGNLEVELKEKDGIAILELGGEIDSLNSSEIGRLIMAYLERGNTKIIVSLKDVTYLDSSGLGILIGGMNKTKEKGGMFKLCGLQNAVRKVFEMAKLVEIFEIHDTEEAALKSF